MIDVGLVLARAVHFAATLLIEGAVVFGVVVLRAPNGGKYRPSLPGLDTMVAAAWAFALLSGAAWLVLLAAQIDGTGPGAALRDGTDWALLSATQFGASWRWRLAGFVALAAVLIMAKRLPASRCALDIIAILLSMALAGSLVWSGHGAATPGAIGDLHLAADVVHLIAAGIWLGALLPFALVLLGAGERADIEAITRRFSALALASVLALMVSGIVNGWLLVGSLSALVTTLYGALLLAKLALFLLMLAFAAVNRLVLTPRLVALSKSAGNARSRLAIHSVCELALGAAILMLVGVLGTLAPPAHAPHAHAAHASTAE
jgi:putative copper resistance protein D